MSAETPLTGTETAPTDATTAAGRSNKSEPRRRGRSNTIIRTLRDIRTDADLSLRALEGLSGVSAAYLSQIERGVLMPTAAQTEAIEHGLGLPSGSLVVRTMLIHEEAGR